MNEDVVTIIGANGGAADSPELRQCLSCGRWIGVSCSVCIKAEPEPQLGRSVDGVWHERRWHRR